MKRLLLATTFLASSVMHVLPAFAFVGSSAPAVNPGAPGFSSSPLVQVKGTKGHRSSSSDDDDDQGDDNDDQGEDDQGDDNDDQGEDGDEQ